MKSFFAPMDSRHKTLGNPSSSLVNSGVGIFTALPVTNIFEQYYVGARDAIPLFYKDSKRGIVHTNKTLLSISVSFEGSSYIFATTHFTWTPDGGVTEEQRIHLKKLFAILDAMPEVVLAGDFNAPRGQEIFGVLARKYKDNIPPEYESSLDPKFHRAGQITKLMVDGLFSTPQYEVTDVKLSEGVSDHMAVTAFVSKK